VAVSVRPSTQSVGVSYMDENGTQVFLAMTGVLFQRLGSGDRERIRKRSRRPEMGSELYAQSARVGTDQRVLHHQPWR
jgi:hypothetical protein